MTDVERTDWNEIVDSHAQRVLRIARRILGSIEDAEDISQEVFSEAYRMHLSGKKPVRTWEALLVRLATLRSLDSLRKNRPMSEFQVSDCISTVQPSDEVVAIELAQWLRGAIAQLPDQQAAVFVMSCFEQFSREEVSGILGISTDAVSTSLYKARQRLSTELTFFYHGDVK
ncbi:MAG: sigma-70 family RNA polymerase sigma factor [Planctomycetaceae bacterium]|nr:sigma-70 family RNA polymerase sigma factor [Planctomycetaceae bacterium]